MTATIEHLDIRPRTARGEARFGIDAPMVLVAFAAVAAACAVLAFVAPAPWLWALVSLGFVLQLGSYLYATRRGKFQVWERLLDDLALRGDEQVLDLGCGRGAVLLAAARRVPAGSVDGVDVWRTADQSGNAESVTRANVVAEGLDDLVTLTTADVADLPFEDDSFDVVLSSLCLHNVHEESQREAALDEAVRVLRPGGRLVVVDIQHVPDHAAALARRGVQDVRVQGLGPRGWFANPWVRLRAVTGRAA